MTMQRRQPQNRHSDNNNDNNQNKNNGPILYYPPYSTGIFTLVLVYRTHTNNNDKIWKVAILCAATRKFSSTEKDKRWRQNNNMNVKWKKKKRIIYCQVRYADGEKRVFFLLLVSPAKEYIYSRVVCVVNARKTHINKEVNSWHSQHSYFHFILVFVRRWKTIYIYKTHIFTGLLLSHYYFRHKYWWRYDVVGVAAAGVGATQQTAPLYWIWNLNLRAVAK